MVSDRFRELSSINEEKGAKDKKPKHNPTSESKTPNLSSKIKSNFITKYKNTHLENKLNEGLTDSIISQADLENIYRRLSFNHKTSL